MSDVLGEPLWLREWRAIERRGGAYIPSETECEALIWRSWDWPTSAQWEDDSTRATHICPKCGEVVLMRGPNKRGLHQCSHCRFQTSVIALTAFRGFRLPLNRCLSALSLYFSLREQARPGLMAQALNIKFNTAKRLLAVCRYVFETNSGSLFPLTLTDTAMLGHALIIANQKQRYTAEQHEFDALLDVFKAFFAGLSEEQKRQLHTLYSSPFGRTIPVLQVALAHHFKTDRDSLADTDSRRFPLKRSAPMFISKYTKTK